MKTMISNVDNSDRVRALESRGGTEPKFSKLNRARALIIRARAELRARIFVITRAQAKLRAQVFTELLSYLVPSRAQAKPSFDSYHPCPWNVQIC